MITGGIQSGTVVVVTWLLNVECGVRKYGFNKLDMMRDICFRGGWFKTEIGTLGQRVTKKDTGCGLGG